MKKRFIYCLPLFILSAGAIHAQSIVLTAGADASGTDGTVSYSIGQTTYLYKGSGPQVMEGVQQPYEITSLSAGEIQPQIEGILLYPNPFKDYLYLDFTVNSYEAAEYQLFDSQGKLIRTDLIQHSKSELNFSSLPSAMYIIRISRKGEYVKTFKIIKN